MKKIILFYLILLIIKPEETVLNSIYRVLSIDTSPQFSSLVKDIFFNINNTIRKIKKMRKELLEEMNNIMLRMRMFEARKKMKIKQLKQFLVNDILFKKDKKVDSNKNLHKIKNTLKNRSLNLNNVNKNNDKEHNLKEKLQKFKLMKMLSNNNNQLKILKNIINNGGGQLLGLEKNNAMLNI